MRAQIAITRNGITRHLSRQDNCLRLALRALGILERVNELSNGRELSVSELEGVIALLSQSAFRSISPDCDAPTLFERAASHRPPITQSMTAMCFASSGFLAIYIQAIQ